MLSPFQNKYKENLPPIQKQGILYEIKTGKNHGVFLAKDITHDNYRSLSLLTKDAQQAHKSYVQTLGMNCKEGQQSPENLKKLSDVESFNNTYDFCQKNIKHLQHSSRECATSIKKLHMDMANLKQKIAYQTSQLQSISLPVLKNIRQKLKKGKSQQNAISSKMSRQLLDTQQCFSLVTNGIKQCDRRIQISEEAYGVSFYEI